MEPISPFSVCSLPEADRRSPIRTTSALNSSCSFPQLSANAWSIINIETGEVL